MRLDFLALAIAQEGKPYVWAANGPDAFDCSGFIDWLCRTLNLSWWTKDRTANDILTDFPEVMAPRPGTLVLYGRKGDPRRNASAHANHVMIHWGDGRVLGASGGNSDTTSIEIARQKGARVRFQKSRAYRPDFIGYRELPLDEAPTKEATT